MSKTDELNKLFEKWIKDFPVYKGKFIRDGVINESEYKGQSDKVLFLAKEPNDPDQEGEWDFREWWSKEIKYTFSHRICEWAYGLINNFPPVSGCPNSNEKRKEIMAKIAFMNIKKSGGGATADNDVIEETLKKEIKYIRDEINIISPDTIISGIGNINYWKLIFPHIRFINSGFDIDVAKVNGFRIINFYHPSYRVPRSMSYSLLGRIYNSEIFKNL